MPVPRGLSDRLAAEAMISGADGYLEMLPALCRRQHLDACRREVLRRADGVVLRKREVPHA